MTSPQAQPAVAGLRRASEGHGGNMKLSSTCCGESIAKTDSLAVLGMLCMACRAYKPGSGMQVAQLSLHKACRHCCHCKARTHPQKQPGQQSVTEEPKTVTCSSPTRVAISTTSVATGSDAGRWLNRGCRLATTSCAFSCTADRHLRVVGGLTVCSVGRCCRQSAAALWSEAAGLELPTVRFLCDSRTAAYTMLERSA